MSHFMAKWVVAALIASTVRHGRHFNGSVCSALLILQMQVEHSASRLQVTCMGVEVGMNGPHEECCMGLWVKRRE